MSSRILRFTVLDARWLMRTAYRVTKNRIRIVTAMIAMAGAAPLGVSSLR